MKSLWCLMTLMLLLSTCTRDIPRPVDYYACGSTLADQSAEHPAAAALQALMEETVAQGVPGIMVTVHDPDYGRWSGAAGHAELIGSVDLQPCQITRAGSTVKIFTAVALLKLSEEGRVDLDAPVADYLSADVLEGIENAGVATVRQLLQHSGGVDNYIRNLQFQTASLNDLTRVWQPMELLAYSRGVPAPFPPGTDVDYSNTGYILLGLVIEAVTGEPFYRYFEKALFEPYGLAFTNFAAEDPVPAGIVRGYVDLYDKGELIDATHFSGWDYFTADGGLISNPYDLNRFVELLFTGKVLSPESLQQMTDFKYSADQPDKDAFRTGYGLGIFAIDTEFGTAYLHSGDAIGYFATVVHFPERGVTLSWATNGNYGQLDDLIQSKAAMERVFGVVLGG